MGPPVSDEHLYKVVDALDEVAKETGRTVPQVALNWLLQRPTVSTVIFGARNEEQLRQNLGAAGWNLTPEQVAKLDRASDVTPVYPYWHQRQFTERNPRPRLRRRDRGSSLWAWQLPRVAFHSSRSSGIHRQDTLRPCFETTLESSRRSAGIPTESTKWRSQRARKIRACERLLPLRRTGFAQSPGSSTQHRGLQSPRWCA